MREQPPRRHLFVFGEAALGQVPGCEQRVDVGVERDLAILGEAEKPAREHRLADRPGKEERRAVDRFRAAEFHDAVALGEYDAVVVDDGETHARHVIRAHAVDEVERDVGLVGDAHAIPEVVLDGRGVLSAGGGRRKDDE